MIASETNACTYPGAVQVLYRYTCIMVPHVPVLLAQGAVGFAGFWELFVDYKFETA